MAEDFDGLVVTREMDQKLQNLALKMVIRDYEPLAKGIKMRNHLHDQLSKTGNIKLTQLNKSLLTKNITGVVRKKKVVKEVK